MDQTPQPDASEPRFTPSALFILALGLLAGAWVFFTADPLLGLAALAVGVLVWFFALTSRRAPVPPPPALAQVSAPSGRSSVTLTAPGPNPDGVVFVWHQFRALDPSEERTPEQLRALLGEGAPVLLASGVTRRWAEDLAEALRRTGAQVQVEHPADPPVDPTPTGSAGQPEDQPAADAD